MLTAKARRRRHACTSQVALTADDAHQDPANFPVGAYNEFDQQVARRA